MSALLGLGSSPKTAATQPQRANGVQINASDYGKALPIVYGRARVPGICIWYGDFKATENKQQVGKGGGGSVTSYTYSFSFALAFAEGPIGAIRSLWLNSAKVTKQPDVTRLGTAGQTTWAYWGADAVNGPALTYPYVCWAAWQNWNAGSSPNTPQVNAELDGLLQYDAAGGIYGAEPSAILTDLLGAGVHGSNWPWLGDLTQFKDYCVANSLFLSPVLDTETALSDILTQLLQITNTQPVWDGGLLQLVPNSDETITGNGITFTPDIAPIADLGPDDLLGPVQIDRKPDGDLYNIVRVEWINAAANYVTSVAQAKDLSHITDHDERAMETIQAHAITDPAVATQVARTILQQQLFIRNTFTFEVPLTRLGIKPMQVYTLTDALAGLDHEPVRIVSVTENGDLTFQIEAEEFPAGVAQGAAHALEAHAGFVPDAQGAPDTTATPVFFRAPPGLSGVAGTPAMWAGIAGSGPNWGGANVWASLDNASFTLIGTVRPGCRYGTLKTALAVGADPDVANSCELTLIGPGQLTGGSDNDADEGITLILVDQELIGYSATTLNADGSYTIGANYLRRGMYGTQIAAHAIGAPWLRVDDNFFAWSFAHDDVGKTVYIKLQAFNLYGGGTEDLSVAADYSYVLGSAEEVPDTPPVPTNTAVTPIADGIAIVWDNTNPAAVARTEIQFSLDGAAWTVLGDTAGTSYPHHFTDGKTYYYRLRARSAAFVWSAFTATISSTGKTVANGATAGATIGPGGNVGGAVDPSGYPYINLADGGHFNKNLDNVLDGTDYARIPGAATYGSGIGRRTFVDFASGYNLNQNADNIPAGSVYSPVRLTSLTGGNVDLSLAGVAGRNLGNMADATGRYAVTNGGSLYGVSLVDSNNRAGIDFANGINLNQNQDYVASGSSYVRTPAGSNSENVIQNGTPSVGTAGSALAGWRSTDGYTDTDPNGNAGALVARAAGLSNYASAGTNSFGVRAGETYFTEFWYKTGGAGNFYFYFADGSNWSSGLGFPTGWTYASYTYTVPSGRSGAQLEFANASSTADWIELWGVSCRKIRSLDTEIANGTTYGRVLNSRLSSGTPFIDLASGLNLNQNADNIPAGSVYSPVRLTSLTGGNVDLSLAGVGGRNLGNIGDATGRYAVTNGAGLSAVSAVDGNNKALVDFSQGGHTNKNVDNIDDGTNYSRVPNYFNAENVIFNGTPTVGSSGTTLPGWYGTSGYTDTDPNGNAGALVARADGVASYSSMGSNGFAVLAGETYFCEFWYKTGGAGSWLFYFNDGSNWAQGLSAPAGWTRYSVTYTVPSGRSHAFFTIANASSTADWIEVWGMSCRKVRNLATETGGILASTTSQKPVTVGSYGSAWGTSLSISYTTGAGTGTGTISVSAATLVAGSQSISYNSSSVSISGTVGYAYDYYLYYNDPTYSGGSQTLVATLTPQNLTAGDGYVYVGKCHVVYASSTTSGGGTGGGSTCVVVETVLPGHERAGDVVPGDYLDLANPITFERHRGLVSYAKTETVLCVCITTENGIELECSLTAPIAVDGGETVPAPDLLDRFVPVCDFGEWRVERVIAVEFIGMREVRHITCENDVFLAGKRRGRYVLHHNAKP